MDGDRKPLASPTGGEVLFGVYDAAQIPKLLPAGSAFLECLDKPERAP
jgi:hypothetical protein